MDDVILDSLLGYWTPQAVAVNINVILNILGAMFLGLLVGYERSYRGRAAGMRIYGLVCMSSCAFVVIAGYPQHWYGGHFVVSGSAVDISRIIQGITTGIGFLGAGVIMRDGMNISGLTTAASIWAVATIGVLVGIGFYGSAITMAVFSTALMIWGSRMENLLPARHAIAIMLRFKKEFDPTEDYVARLANANGYDVARGSFSLSKRDDMLEWRFVAVSFGKGKAATLVKLGEILKHAEGIEDFHIAYARN